MDLNTNLLKMKGLSTPYPFKNAISLSYNAISLIYIVRYCNAPYLCFVRKD